MDKLRNRHLIWQLVIFCVFTLITYSVISYNKLDLSEFTKISNYNYYYPKYIGAIISSGGSNNESDGSSNVKVVILMWSNYYELKGDDVLRMIHSGRKWDPSCCEGPDVEVTLDRSRLQEAAAVVIFAYFGNLALNDLPPVRRQDQLWILFLKESPMHSQKLTPFNSMFNWTMSYRRDSEIWAPYGEYMEKENESEVIKMPGGVTLDDWVKNKTKLVAGVYSHCPTASRREKLWRALRNESLPVDIFGGCGKHICSRLNLSCNHTKFWIDLAKQYKFYLAAENSLCFDYVTEKFWRTLDVGMVPVVYGSANYTDLAPPNSFIDTRDFASPTQLAGFLLWLDGHPTEYKRYFQWRSKFKLKLGDGWSGWCDLCRKVREFRENETLPSESKYNHLGRWWTHVPILNNSMSSDKVLDSHVCDRPQFSF